MPVTAPDPDLPDWLGHWSHKALLPVILAVGYVQLFDAPVFGPTVFVVVFEAMLVVTHLEDTGRLGERQSQLAIGSVALVGAVLLLPVDGDAFQLPLFSLGLFSLGKAAVTDWEWSSSLEHPFSARDRPSEDPVRDGVLAALADRPHTRRELWETVAADAEAIDRTLETLRTEGTVTRAGSEFRLARSE